MGRIKKAAGPKHEATVSPAVAEFVAKGATIPVSQLPAHLQDFPRGWPFPRGDLYNWIPLLNRFDLILEKFNQEYGLHNGPQTIPFGRTILENGVAEEGKNGATLKTTSEDLDKLGFAQDGDKQLACAIVSFSRELLENCGNRSLYSSSDRLGDLLNTVDLSLLAIALQLAVRLAQRYHASRQRGANASQSLNNALLASHYNIDLEKVQRLANPFTKNLITVSPDSQSPANKPQGSKGKERTRSSQGQAPTSVEPSDLSAIASEQSPMVNGSAGKRAAKSVANEGSSQWEEWGYVQMRYYHTPLVQRENAKIPSPTTPTPARRPSNLSRVSRVSMSDDATDSSAPAPPSKTEEIRQGGMKTLEIPSSKITSSSMIEILKDSMVDIPKDSQYELLTRLRVASAMVTSTSSRQELLVVRLLALTNLAYVYPDTMFQQKILQQDSDEPRRLQLAYQLAELLQSSRNGSSSIPIRVQTAALGALESLTKHKSRAADVSAALNVNVNHGILLHTLKKAGSDLASEKDSEEDYDEECAEYREALLSLLDALPTSAPRTSESLIGAGLFDVLIDILKLRTSAAERYHYRALTFLNTIVYAVRDAIQTLANAKGLDAISDLIADVVSSSIHRAKDGQGIPTAWRNQVIDYQIPYFQQGTLRWLFKFVNHMMSHGAGNFDRLLRNLIDSPQLLGGLKMVITNPKVFGASVWSAAVTILSSFIHNEPTSYGIIAEAGLSKGFLETVSSETIDDPKDSKADSQPSASPQEDQDVTVISPTASPSQQFLEKLNQSIDRGDQLAQGILPATDAIVAIPSAFGAICLNNAGLSLFLRSSALWKFFEIFESPEHVKAMTTESELPRLLGNSLDELVRHYPLLKELVMQAILVMVKRVYALCKNRATKLGLGAKLWVDAENGKPEVAGGFRALKGEDDDKPLTRQDSDVVMVDAESSKEEESDSVDFDQLVTDDKSDEITASYVGTLFKFFLGFFENTNICSAFIDAGGVEPILDFTTLSCLQYDFNNQAASQEISRVIHMLVEQKPHLVMPSLVNRTQAAVDVLEPLCDHADTSAYFGKYTAQDQSKIEDEDESSANGTRIVKNLVAVHTLCNVLFEAFSSPVYNARSNHTVFTQVNLTDMYVKLIKSLGRLHRVCVWEEILLQKAMPESWKDATKVKGYGMGSQEADDVFGLIQRDEPASDGDEAQQDGAANGVNNGDATNAPGTASDNKKRRKSSIRKEESIPQFQNVRVLRYLLSQLPSSIVPFFQGLGKALIAKRRPEFWARQSAHMVADAMSAATLEQLNFQAPRDSDSAKDRYSYWIVILTSISQLLIEGNCKSHSVPEPCSRSVGPADHPSHHCLTLVLQAFKNAGGLDEVKGLLGIFFDEVKALSNPGKNTDMTDAAARLATAYGGIKIILNLYTQVSAAKTVIESPQTTALQSNERDRGQAHHFLPPQFLVELRVAVLPVVRSIWDSDFVDNASSSIVKCLVEILRICLESSDEDGAYKRGNKVPVRAKHIHRPYPVSEEKVNAVKGQGFDAELAREAVYRCYNGQHLAIEYCRARQNNQRNSQGWLVTRHPIPEYDQEPRKEPPTDDEQGQSSEAMQPQEGPSNATDAQQESYEAPLTQGDSSEATISEPGRIDTPANDTDPSQEQHVNPDPEPSSNAAGQATGIHAHGIDSLLASAPALGIPEDLRQRIAALDDGQERLTGNLDNLLNLTDFIGGDLMGAQAEPSPDQATPSTSEASMITAAKGDNVITVTDLDDERAAIRENLIERALDVLNVHSDVTFELSDLINAAALKAPDSSSMRKDIGDTLVQSLISLQLDDDFRPAGKKIAAYANLLGLVLQDDDFYRATLDELRSNFASLLSFVRMFPDQKAEEASPWIGQVLLVIERVLSEDAQPTKIQWTPPSSEEAAKETPVATLEDPVLSMDDKTSLFNALIDILPRIGKDESLALSVVRALAIVTRNRSIADRLAEKKNIQRLFVMVKQLAGSMTERLQGSFMLILRHIVEDDSTLRRVMRSEILRNFENRPGRAPDTTTYVRQMNHLVLRNPRLFVEITNEELEIKDYDPGPNPHARPHLLSLKPEQKEEILPTDPMDTSEPKAEDGAHSEVQPGDQLGDQPVEVNGSGVDNVATKSKAAEVKPPVVENPSGVIHYILCEILSYRDVEDKDPSTGKRRSSEASVHELGTEPSTESASGIAGAEGHGTEGLWISTDAANPDQGSGSTDSNNKKTEKSELKPEQHPIYVYRCFLLQFLAELLHSYNRTKVEFINFSRKADLKTATPSKPRSTVLNYLLNDLVPIGTLNHEESIAFRKKSVTSNWALSVVVALCLKTNEKGYDKRRGSVDEEDDTELLFVRKFVLEHALKAYRDANSSSEMLDAKYARLLSLADLFDRLLQGRIGQPMPTHTSPSGNATQKHIAKLMFEKNFLTALTTSIADVDLNFPQSKRAIKYILKPMKQLTSTAIHLSETSSIVTTPGQTDDDEISSATSVSDLDAEREETPDLFRNSTLGMFEPGRNEESSSDSSNDDDEEMYEDEYDDGMEYDEEMERDAGEVISDEDEEIEGAGNIEGLPGDMGMDVEVVIDGDEDGPSDGDDDDEDEDEGGSEGMDGMDDDGVEVMEEIIQGEENNSLGDDDEANWQDEDDLPEGMEYGREEDEEEMALGSVAIENTAVAEATVRNIMREFAGDEEILQRLQEENTRDMDVEGDQYPDDGAQDDEEAEDDEDEEGEEEELVYQTDYMDDEPGMPDPSPPWGWDPDDPTFMPPTRHHHHHPRRIVSPWTVFPAGHPSDRGPIYRSHRPTGGPRSADDGTNPLLHRQGRNSATSGLARGGRSGLSDAGASMSDFWVHGMDPGPFPRNSLSTDSPVSFVNNIIAAIGQSGPGLTLPPIVGPQGGPIHFHVGAHPAAGRLGMIPRELQALLGIRAPPPDPVRPPRDDANQTITFTPQSTSVRWQEEARLLFGSAHADKAQRIVNNLLRVLVPPAMERKKHEEEEAKRMREARLKAQEEERRVKEEIEKAEKEEKERVEKEEREAAAAAEAERQAAQPEAEGEDTEGDDGAMEGVEIAHEEEESGPEGADEEDQEGAEAPTSVEEPADASSSAPAERVRTSIRGRDLDITGMGVDLEYLEALPEDLREEVLMHQLALQRSQAVAAGEAPSDISREFLEALPPDIREELLQQEAQDRRRREREEERRRRAAESGAPPRAEEMDPASFLASLDPGLRQTVLMDQDEEVLAQLPQSIAAEARALGVDRGYRGYGGMPGHHRARAHNHDNDVGEGNLTSKKSPRKQIVQMIDKAGVATLLRLMFVPQQGSSRQSLNNILHDISQNRQTRAEVISLLLSILQDGSTDVNAVERSFAHLSLRAKQPASQKTPQPLKRALTGTMTSPGNSEMTPLMVVQQCLNALVFLTQYNPHIPSFFLTEHEVSSGLRTKSNRKGKGKETRAQKFALNALLSLLDRKLIMESSACMEQLSSLLQAVTHPLTMLLRANKDKSEKDEKDKTTEAGGDQPVQNAGTDANTPQVQTGESNSQPAGPTSVETNAVVPDAATELPPIEGPVATDPSAEATVPPTEDQTAKEAAKSEEEKVKKQRILAPPVVPEENLRLVVNILAARECSGKTFRDTLSTINNLSAIPGAKEVFGSGLIEQAKDLGQSIVVDLDEVVPQIKEASSAADVQGMALARFSPASSDQAKLLRILTALDYLFDAKRNNGKSKSSAEDKASEGQSSVSQEDLLTSLYENPTFGTLWNKLSECLGAIRQGEGMLNIATILLPLIESLMVVCKNTTIKDAPLVKAVKEFSVASPPPESGMESLFFRFTEEHRKILNDLVRHNPKLMSGTFSLLVKNPKVLEFDNKRNYFNRRLHSRSEARHPQPPLQLNVRRDQVFLDSYKFMHFKSGDEIKYGKLNIRFHGEEGVDAGGVSREWFQVLSRQMFNPDYALFVPVASDRTTFHPNKLSKVNEEHLDFFKFIGRIIGKALYEGRALDCHFSRAVYKRILGKTVSIKDMETLDLEYYKSLLWMLENDITEIITETFSVETEDFGVTETVDLIENGRNVSVTEENKHEYVQLVVEYRLTGSVQAQLGKFLGGFHDVVSPELIAIFNEQELELLISGLPDIDVDDWKNNTEYHNYSASSSQIQWFWRAVRSFDKEVRAKLLQFVTGTSKVPLNGFSQLEGMNGFSRFNIHRDYGNKDRLPSSHTCFNQLDLPEYDSYEQLRQQVYTAVTAGSEYFGFA
ncbi:MAG: hypothetical protein Q9203_005037 [Teloschistes exilis]